MAGNNHQIDVLIASEHPVFRDGLRRVLEAEGGFEVVGVASNGPEALKLARKLRPEIVLHDLILSTAADWKNLRCLTSLPTVYTILLNGFSRSELVTELLQAGVRGVISKQSPVLVLVRCIRKVLDGQYWVGRDSVDTIIEALRGTTPSVKAPTKINNFGITPRELEVVAAVVAGRTNKVIAKELSLSEQTVKHQLTSIFDKLGVSGRLELAIFANNHGLVSRTGW
ncbi:MAG TPA: response regulator transcription factor [Terriglobia bacterium]|nr:response regulator transcription factor [Terriglobia bacterium]